MEDELLKFKSYANIRKVFNVAAFFEAATDQDIDEFSDHPNVHVEDLATFKETCDQTARRLVYAISKRGILDDHTPPEIVERALAVGLEIHLNEGRIGMPTTRAAVKMLLRFLDDGLYRASLSGNDYIANSKRPILLQN